MLGAKSRKVEREQARSGAVRREPALGLPAHRWRTARAGRPRLAQYRPPAPARGRTDARAAAQGPSWREFLHQQTATVLACDSSPSRRSSLRRYYVLFFIELGSRRVQLAGCTISPTGARVTQQARNLSVISLPRADTVSDPRPRQQVQRLLRRGVPQRTDQGDPNADPGPAGKRNAERLCAPSGPSVSTGYSSSPPPRAPLPHPHESSGINPSSERLIEPERTPILAVLATRQRRRALGIDNGNPEVPRPRSARKPNSQPILTTPSPPSATQSLRKETASVPMLKRAAAL